MELGNFSVSLAVKDIEVSKAFYEKLGFKVFFGEPGAHFMILKNGACTLGLFQGMFENNILTFNPGWDAEGNEVEEYTDVRELQKKLKAQGLELTTEADENGSGPGHFALVDPDGNAILVDQHV